MSAGAARYVALLGHPVRHSVSQAMQEAAFSTVGLSWRYLPFDVVPERLRVAMRALVDLDFVGANVTVPHKEAALRLAEHADEIASMVGACNTLCIRDGSLYAHNTDVAGFTEAVETAFGNVLGGHVVVLGAGGAARAVLAGCLSKGARHVRVLNRSVERARKLVASFSAGETKLEVGPLDEAAFADALRDAALVVQTTSCGTLPDVGWSPIAWPPSLPSSLCVFDLVYNPRPTRFMQEASALGADVCDGLGMLVAQGAHAFELWSGQEAPRDVMQQAAAASLKDF